MSVCTRVAGAVDLEPAQRRVRLELPFILGVGLALGVGVVRAAQRMMLREDPLRIFLPQRPQAHLAAQLGHTKVEIKPVLRLDGRGLACQTVELAPQVRIGSPKLGQRLARRWLRHGRHGGSRQPRPEARPRILQAPVPRQGELPLASDGELLHGGGKASLLGSSDAASARVSSTAARHRWACSEQTICRTELLPSPRCPASAETATKPRSAANRPASFRTTCKGIPIDLSCANLVSGVDGPYPFR